MTEVKIVRSLVVENCPCTPRATFAMILKTGQTELCHINVQIIGVYALQPQLFEKLSWSIC